MKERKQKSKKLCLSKSACGSFSKNFRKFCVKHFAFSFLFFVLFFSVSIKAQNKYENLRILSSEVEFEAGDKGTNAVEQFRAIINNTLDDSYSTVNIRDTIQALYDTKKIVSVKVEAIEGAEKSVNLKFVIRRKLQTGRVSIELLESKGEDITKDQLLLQTNISNPSVGVSEQTLRENAEAIQLYLRERGFYNSEVTSRQELVSGDNRVGIVFVVDPKNQAKVEAFNITIKGFEGAPLAELKEDLILKAGEDFTQRKLERDVEKIRSALIREDFVAPRLDAVEPVYDSDKNLVTINVKGDVGPKVIVKIDAENKKVGESKQRELLAIKREGSLEQSAIVEGERRLRNYFQQQGYFFAEVSSLCAVQPEFPPNEFNILKNETAELCAALSGEDLTNKEVSVNYKADLNRRLKLVDIRITGTDEFVYKDVSAIIDTQKASLLGLIPRLGYGRGFTSNETLESDRQRLESIMRELGYRRAKVSVRQGVSPNGEDLIITFSVEEGIPTVIDSIEIVGNSELSDKQLRDELPNLVGRNYSRARARNGVRKIASLYSREGYYDSKVSFSIDEIPVSGDAEKERVKVIFNVENEGKKVFINDIIIAGNEKTKREAILRFLDIKQNQVLRATDIFTSEQNLYSTDAFRTVEIKPEPAGETQNGDSQRNVIVNVEELPARIMTYGGGFSTDVGPTGFFDIRHVNLFGKLWQAGARVRVSRLQQLVQVDFLNPRFLKDGEKSFAPLSISAQYQRDSTVTRFFRSTFDKGTFGIVQRIDEDGNAIDVFGNKVANPTLRRLNFTAETQRAISRKQRSILFLRYKYEDVRISDVDSLLIGELLRPDEIVRTSGFGATFVRDTRENCMQKFTVLDIVAKGDLEEPCRYSASDPTRGSFLTVEYNFSAPFLGANLGFSKFQATYQTYYQLPRITKKLDNTIIAGRIILGLGQVFSRSKKFTGQFEALNGSLPISERFFAGGSTTLRGFAFEEAGPRVVVEPQGIFRNSKGEIVTLKPFTVPFGGNAVAVTNLEARIPLTTSIQAVPFYDGGNVFNRVGDIFKPLKSETGDVFRDNLRATWKHTFGLGLRFKTPFGQIGADYGYLVNPPRFLIPQPDGSNANFILKQHQLHFRFSQTF